MYLCRPCICTVCRPHCQLQVRYQAWMTARWSQWSPHAAVLMGLSSQLPSAHHACICSPGGECGLGAGSAPDCARCRATCFLSLTRVLAAWHWCCSRLAQAAWMAAATAGTAGTAASVAGAAPGHLGHQMLTQHKLIKTSLRHGWNYSWPRTRYA